MNTNEIFATTKNWLPKLKALRRQLHKYPETAPTFTQTHKIILDKLKSCKLKQIKLQHSHSLCFELQGDLSGPTLLFCANMSGTALMDHSKENFHSLVPGYTHSEQNHDAEITSLIGLMWCAQKLKSTLHGNIRILFMADDINSTSSLRELQQNVFNDIKYATHFEFSNRYHYQRIYYSYDYSKPRIDQFNIAYRDNPSQAQIKSNKTVFMASKLVTQLPIIIKQSLGELTPVGFKFTKIHAQDAHNIQPNHIEIEGNLYTYDKELANATFSLITDLVQNQMLGPSAVISTQMAYPPLYNDTNWMNQLLPMVSQLVDEQSLIEHPIPMLTNSHFSIISESIPSVQLTLGTQKFPFDEVSSNTFEESCLSLGLSALLSIVCHYQDRGNNVLTAKFDGAG
ncbi:MAG: hypothetical protein P8L77_03210 [Gammaproteobacteria bacterium]|nr:hypothetical protein [Gammaproteobacteria bacterium]